MNIVDFIDFKEYKVNTGLFKELDVKIMKNYKKKVFKQDEEDDANNEIENDDDKVENEE